MQLSGIFPVLVPGVDPLLIIRILGALRLHLSEKLKSYVILQLSLIIPNMMLQPYLKNTIHY